MKRATYIATCVALAFGLSGCGPASTSNTPQPTVTVVQTPKPTVTVTVNPDGSAVSPSSSDTSATQATPTNPAAPAVSKLTYGQRAIFVVPADDGKSTTRLGVSVKPPVMMKSLSVGNQTLNATGCPSCVLALVDVQTSILDTATTIDMGKTMKLGNASPLSVDSYAGRMAKVTQGNNFMMTTLGDDVYTFDPQYGTKSDVAFVFKLPSAKLPPSVTWKLGDKTVIWSSSGANMS